MKNVKIIVITAIVSLGLSIGGQALAVFVGSGLSPNVSPVQTIPLTPEQKVQNEKNAETLAKLQQSPYYDSSLNAMLLKMLSHIDELETRIITLEAKQNITPIKNSSISNTTNTTPCLSISEQIKKGYIYNICTGLKL